MKEAVLLAVGLVRGLLDAAANHLWTRAPDEGILRTDLHQAAREMEVDALFKLSDALGCQVASVLPTSAQTTTEGVWVTPLPGTSQHSTPTRSVAWYHG